MRIVIGSDHRGYELKKALLGILSELGHEYEDVGTHSSAAADYPVYAEAVGKALREGRADRGILICGSGVGASVAANKIPGVRAAICHDTYSARQGVEHDDMNVLVMGSRIVGDALARELVVAFLGAEFSGESRHQKRLDQVRDLEVRYAAETASKRSS